MVDQLTVRSCFIVLALWFHCVYGHHDNSKYMYLAKGNFTYTPDDILATFTAFSLLQCSHRCSVTQCCLAVEWQGSTSTCVVLEIVRPATNDSEWDQYMVREWTYYSGSHYVKTECDNTMPTCSDICSGYGGHLAVLTTAEEATFARQFGIAWLGGTLGGSWTWINGKAFSYTSWCPGQPDNPATSRCLGNDVNGWYDRGCSNLLPCLCEI